MSILSQEIVDYLNQAGGTGLGDWLEKNPVVRNFVTCPYISIRPTAIPHARRITAFDGQGGRFIDIEHRNGSHRYIIDVASWNLTVEQVEKLIQEIDQAAGSCHVERSFLILYVPAGYSIEIEQTNTINQLQLHAL
jgi:hypothetical protein